MPLIRLPRPLIAVLLAGAAWGGLLAPAVAAADGEAAFTAKVWPIIDNSCTGCHGADKQKGKLRLDTRAGWLKGGEDGQIVVPGNPEKSLVMDAIRHTTKDEDQYMPPKKKKQLTKDEIAIIGDWIKAGMPWPEAKK